MLGIRECWRERTSLIPTVSKDYIVELNFLGKYFTSDCLRACYGGTGKLHVSAYGREKTCECHRIIITGDDTVDGPTGESLYFYYLDGKGFTPEVTTGWLLQIRMIASSTGVKSDKIRIPSG